jgi:hypothetical protein
MVALAFSMMWLPVWADSIMYSKDQQALALLTFNRFIISMLRTLKTRSKTNGNMHCLGNQTLV